MNKRKISVGYPKGNVHGKSKCLVEKQLNIIFPKEKLHIESDDYDVFFLKHRDIARLVAEGKLDFGVTSEEWLREIMVDTNVNVLKKLDWCNTKIALITNEGNDKEIKKCVTEFYNIAVDYFKQSGQTEVYVEKISGSSEALVPVVYDCCIDCVETGTTLKENGLIIKDVIFESSMVLISNPSIPNPLIKKFCDVFFIL